MGARAAPLPASPRFSGGVEEARDDKDANDAGVGCVSPRGEAGRGATTAAPLPTDRNLWVEVLASRVPLAPPASAGNGQTIGVHGPGDRSGGLAFRITDRPLRVCTRARCGLPRDTSRWRGVRTRPRDVLRRRTRKERDRDRNHSAHWAVHATGLYKTCATAALREHPSIRPKLRSSRCGAGASRPRIEARRSHHGGAVVCCA